MRAAAAAWAAAKTGSTDRSRPAPIDEDLRRQYLELGVTPPPDAPDDTILIFAGNWPSLMAWLACETQWRTAGHMAAITWIGLDYTAVDIVLRRRGFATHVFEDMQAMEEAALEVLNAA
ncbi:MAG: DUF1799 domain-containing protein [Rhizobium sp.]|nr:DUF1799 domain-containing protein [Rhizobium sp.]